MNNKVCIAPIKNVKQEDGSDISIIIPAAKYGRNLKGYGNKSLLKTGNITLIEKQLNIIQNVYPKADVVIIINDDGCKIRKIVHTNYPHVRFVYNPNISETNILYSIGLGLYNILHNRLIIIPGDIVFDIDTIKDITHGNSKTLIDTQHNISKHKVGIITINNLVSNYCYDIPTKWGQIIYLANNELKLFESIATNKDFANKYFHEGLNQIIEKGGKIYGFTPPSYFLLEIDTPQDIERLKKLK